MSGTRILGQVLLWGAFLAAALAAVSRVEIDILPNQEPELFPRLESDLAITEDQLKSVTDKEIKSLSSEEFAAVVEKIIPIAAKNKKEREEAAEAAKQNGDTDYGGSENSENEDDDEQSKVKTFDKSYFVNERLSNVENKWPTIPWLWYGLSMVAGIIGVVILRATSKSAEQESGRVAEEFSIITTSLTRLNTNIGRLAKEIDKTPMRQVVNFIDDECAEDFAQFADARNALVQRYGLSAFAEIMTQFSSAERFTNRTWSAAADGYIDEVTTSIKRADSHIKQASALLESYEGKVKTNSGQGD